MMITGVKRTELEGFEPSSAGVKVDLDRGY